jgi:putative heme-binding domain-containing protein
MTRLPLHRRLELAEALTANHDPVDRALSLMTWYGVERAVPTSVNASIRLADTCRDALIRQFILKRLVADTSLADLAPIIDVMSDAEGQLQTVDILQGLYGGLMLRDEMPSRSAWSPVAQRLYDDEDAETSQLAFLIGLKLSDPAARQSLKQVALDVTAEPMTRRKAIAALAADDAADAVELLFRLLDDSAVRVEAIRGLARARTPRVADAISERYADLSSGERREAITTLTARPEWVIQLLESINAGDLPATDVASHQIRQMALLKNPQIDKLIARIWPVNRKTSGEKERQIQRYKSILGEDFLELGDPVAGRALYHKACATCHKLFDDGGDLGPELTGSGRKNVDYILQNVVDPSATMSETYRMSVVETMDGDVLSGLVVERSSTVIEVRNPETSRLLKRSEVDSISPLDQSLMPDGLLDTFSEQQIRDLVAYLFSDQQVALPSGAE